MRDAALDGHSLGPRLLQLPAPLLVRDLSRQPRHTHLVLEPLHLDRRGTRLLRAGGLVPKLLQPQRRRRLATLLLGTNELLPQRLSLGLGLGLGLGLELLPQRLGLGQG